MKAQGGMRKKPEAEGRRSAVFLEDSKLKAQRKVWYEHIILNEKSDPYEHDNLNKNISLCLSV